MCGETVKPPMCHHSVTMCRIKNRIPSNFAHDSHCEKTLTKNRDVVQRIDKRDPDPPRTLYVILAFTVMILQ